MTHTIESVTEPTRMNRIDQQRLALLLVEQARAEGLDLIGAGGRLTGLPRRARDRP